jgi:Mrp family chromosome partitioning ATPase
MDRVEDLRAVARRWWVLVTFAVLGVVVAFVVTPPQSRSQAKVGGQLYRATHTIQLVSVGAPGGLNLLTTAQLLLQRGSVQQRVASSLGPQALPGVALSATPDGVNGTLGINATANDPARAERVADAAASELINVINDQAVTTQKTDVARLNDDIAKLTTQINDVSVRIARENAGDPTQIKSIVDRALQGALTLRLSNDFSQLIAASNPPASFQDQTPAIAVPLPSSSSSSLPTNSRPVKLLLGGIVGLALAAGGVILLSRVDTRIRTRAAAEAALGLPVLAEIPVSGGRQARHWLPVYDDRLSRVAEGYRTLRTAVMLAPPGEEARWDGQGPHVVLIASPSLSEGRSSVTGNLAAAFAEKFARVVAVDGDVRRPELAYLHGADGPPGSGSKGEGSLAEDGTPHPWAPVPTRVPSVFLLPGDGVEARPSGGLSWMHDLIRASKPDADMMLIDTPSLLLFHDAEELLPAADAVVLVVRVGHTTFDAATRTVEQLTRLGGTVLGVCLLGVPQSWAKRRATDRYRTVPAGVDALATSADQYPADWGNGSEPATTTGFDEPDQGRYWSRRSRLPRGVVDPAPATASDQAEARRTGGHQVRLEGWRRDDRVLWRPGVDSLLLLLPGASEPVALSQEAGRVWEALGPPGSGGSANAGDVSRRLPPLRDSEIQRALTELVELGVLVRR